MKDVITPVKIGAGDMILARISYRDGRKTPKARTFAQIVVDRLIADLDRGDR